MLAPDDRMDGREGAPVGPAEFGRGELAPRDAAEFRGLKRMIQAHAGLCCDGYKERVLRRRIAVAHAKQSASRRSGWHRYSGFSTPGHTGGW
jgi:hypothetical protein